MPLNTSGMSNVVVPGDKASASVSKGSSPTAEGLVMAGSVLLSAVHFTSPASLAVTETRSDKPTCVAVTVETMGCTPSGDAQHQAQRQPGEWRLPRHLQHASHNDAPKGKALDATTGPTFPMASMEAQNTLNDMMRTRNRPEIFISYSSKAGPDMMALADAAYVPFRSAELDGWTASA